MPKLTHDQLQEWYAQLKTTLFDQVDIDLNRKEDLGNLRIIRINEWNYDSPDTMPRVDSIYPLIPHRPLKAGEGSSDLMLSYYCYNPPAPDKSNMEEYLQWLMDNITAHPSDEQIQELYDMAAEGQLFVYDGSEPHQIQNSNGEITVTDSFSKIRFPMAPEAVARPQDSGPVYPPKPQEVPAPGEEPRGFFAWFGYIGYRLGIDTEYARYMHRKKAYETYTEDLSTWTATCKQRLEAWEKEVNEPNRLQRMEQEHEAYNNYIQEVINYFMLPLTRFSLAAGGISHGLMLLDSEEVAKQFEQEAQFWIDQHRNTPHGALLTVLEDTCAAQNQLKNIWDFTKQMFGPIYRHNADRSADGIFNEHSDVPSYAVPTSKKFTISREHAALICLSALADTLVLDTKVVGDDLVTLSAQARYQKVLDSFLLKGEPDSDYLFPFVTQARQAGFNAMKDYAQDKPETLGAMLGNCIRRQNNMTTYRGDSYSLKSFAITAALLEVLDAHPALLKNCPLDSEELQQARANAAIYRMNEAGLQAKSDLLDHALRQKDLSREQLRTAAANLLFMNTMNAQAENGIDIRPLMGTPTTMQMAKDALMKQESLDNLVNLNRKELGKAVATPQTLFAKIGQLNPEAQKAPQEKAIEQPQLNQPQHGPAAHP